MQKVQGLPFFIKKYIPIIHLSQIFVPFFEFIYYFLYFILSLISCNIEYKKIEMKLINLAPNI